MALLSARGQGETRVVTYLTNWSDIPTITKTIDYSRISHINVAFENPIDESGNMSFKEEDATIVSKAHSHKVQVLVSIGGGSASEDKPQRERYFRLMSDAKRGAFVAKLAAYVVAHNFDGVDVDIEGPAINKDYGAFVQDLSAALKAKHKLVTAAVSQGYGGDRVPASVFELFDFVNVMAYDATGPWDPKSPGQHASLEFAKSNATYWVGRGLPKSKIVLGVPFYGWGFGKAFRSNDYRYADLIAAYPGAENMDQTGEKIWYNGVPTIKAKAKYVADEALGGIMVWPLDYDAPGEKSLIRVIYDTLHAKDSDTASATKE